MIVDSRGRVVWYHQIAPPQQATDFRVQRYHGKPVLTWWQGIESVAGTGRGEYEIYDTSYRHIATVRAGNGLHGDLHEFQLTPRGTAFITAYREVAADLSGVGGPKRGFVDDSVVEEIDIATGRVLFEWHSIDHVPVVRVDPGAPRAGPQRQPETPARLLPRQLGRRRPRRHSADLGPERVDDLPARPRRAHRLAARRQAERLRTEGRRHLRLPAQRASPRQPAEPLRQRRHSTGRALLATARAAARRPGQAGDGRPDVPAAEEDRVALRRESPAPARRRRARRLGRHPAGRASSERTGGCCCS